MYQELQRKKTELQAKKPYDKDTSLAIKNLNMLDYICSGMILDGSDLSRGQIQGMMDGEMPIGASLKECIFVKNYLTLLDMIQDSLELRSNLDSRLLLKFYNVLVGHKSGFRKSNQMISALKHVPPHHSDVEAKMNQLFYSVYRSSENEIQNAARIHCGLLEIYPFEEYSGIMARLAMNYYLQEKGFFPVALGYNEKEYLSTMIECLKNKNEALFYWGLERAEYNKIIQVAQMVESAEEEI